MSNPVGGDAEAIAEVGPEGDGVLLASLLQRQEGIAASSSLRVLPLILRMVTGSRTSCSELLVLSGTSEGDQQFRFAHLEAREELIELGKAGSAREEAVEVRLQAGPGADRRIGPVKLR